MIACIAVTCQINYTLFFLVTGKVAENPTSLSVLNEIQINYVLYGPDKLVRGLLQRHKSWRTFSSSTPPTHRDEKALRMLHCLHNCLPHTHTRTHHPQACHLTVDQGAGSGGGISPPASAQAPDGKWVSLAQTTHAELRQECLGLVLAVELMHCCLRGRAKGGAGCEMRGEVLLPSDSPLLPQPLPLGPGARPCTGSAELTHQMLSMCLSATLVGWHKGLVLGQDWALYVSLQVQCLQPKNETWKSDR